MLKSFTVLFYLEGHGELPYPADLHNLKFVSKTQKAIKEITLRNKGRGHTLLTFKIKN